MKVRPSAEAAFLFKRPKMTRARDAKRRCEQSFLDFVELFWPVLDPGQPFSRGKVQEAIAMHLEAVHDGRIRNLLGNVPPGSTKTYLVNVFFPAWEWGPKNRPDLRYMSWSYSDALATEANESCRKLIKSELYQRYWGDRFKLDDSSDAKNFYKNDKGGWRRASTLGGGTTGFRADRLIWDDPHNVKDADSPAALLAATRWFSRSLPTRVRNAGGESVKIRVPFWVRDVHDTLEQDPDDDRPVAASATIGIMQRIHLHDISGIILRNPALNYEILLIEMRYKGAEHPARKLPTFPKSTIGYKDWRTQPGELADPVRYGELALRELEAKLTADGLGTDTIAAQLEQWPLEGGSALFTDKTLPVIEPHEAPPGIDKRGWDFASTDNKGSDETAHACVRRGNDGRYYLMDSDGIKGKPRVVDVFVKTQHATDPRSMSWSIPQDPGPGGDNYVSYFIRELAPGRYVHHSREAGKMISARPVSSQAEGGNFVIVRHKGYEVTRAQMIDFPYGDHDDRMDAISRAFAAHMIAAPQQEDDGGFSSEVVAAERVPDTTSSGEQVPDWA